MLSHYFGILDNDPKGLSGAGTQFYAEFSYGDKKVRREWFLGDTLSNKGPYSDYLKELSEFNKLKLEQQNKLDELTNSYKEKLKEEKEKLIADKLHQLDPILIKFMDEVLQDDTKVSAYRSGNEKIINAMIGTVIKNSKSSGLISIDPAVIKAYLIQSING